MSLRMTGAICLKNYNTHTVWKTAQGVCVGTYLLICFALLGWHGEQNWLQMWQISDRYANSFKIVNCGLKMNCRGKSSELAWATFLKFQYKTCHLLKYTGSMCTTLWLHSTAHIFFPNGIFPLVHGFRCQKTANTKEREEGADNFFSSPIGHGSFLKEWKFLTQFSKCLLWLIDSLKLFHLKKDKLLYKIQIIFSILLGTD